MIDWTVKEVTGNVHEIRFTEPIATGWEQWVLLTSDVHLDNKKTNVRRYKEDLKRAKKRNAIIIDIGDLPDVMGGKGDRRRSESFIKDEHKRDDYIDAVIEGNTAIMEPYASQFAVFGRGNHDQAMIKHYSIDVLKHMANRLQRVSGREDRCFVGGYGGWVKFRFNIGGTQRIARNLKYYHGSGGGGVVTKGTIQAQRRAGFIPDADIIATGHIHEAWVLAGKRERFNQNAMQSLDIQWHVQCPTYKEEYQDGSGGWHIERGAPPKPIGCTWIKFKCRSRKRRLTIATEIHQDIE